VAELSLFGKLAKRGDTICDIGAHIGAYTVPLAAAIGAEGTVHAFEPFRLVFQLLMANVAVNGLSNVYGHQMAPGLAGAGPVVGVRGDLQMFGNRSLQAHSTSSTQCVAGCLETSSTTSKRRLREPFQQPSMNYYLIEQKANYSWTSSGEVGQAPSSFSST